MYQMRRTGPIGYEDLMRELALIEHRLLKEDSSVAMNLMVLEAKLRERFQQMEQLVDNKQGFEDPFSIGDGLTIEDIQSLIPQDLEDPSMDGLRSRHKRKRTWETMGMAAFLAILTAVGVFGLASLIQLIFIP